MINDIHLTQLARAITGQSFTIPIALAVSTSTGFSTDPSSPVIVGEIGSRSEVSSFNSSGVAVFNGLRSGAVVPVDGDVLTGVSLFSSAGTSGDLHVSVALPSLLHSSSYDMDFQFNLSYERR